MVEQTIVAIEADDEQFIPEYAHPTDAGADLTAAEELQIGWGEQAMVDCGFSMALSPGFVGLIHPRSGLAAKNGVTVLNAPGTIDAGYRGRVKVILINHGSEPFKVNVGDRIAQLVVQPVTRANFKQIDNIQQMKTARGVGGFGSTGE